MRKALLCSLLAVSPALAPAGALADAAKPKDDTVDISAFKAKLKFWTDGKKHYIAAIPMSIGDEDDDMAFYSPDGKDFYKVNRRSGGADGSKQTFEWQFWEPRTQQASFEALQDDKTKAISYKVNCDERKTTMKPVADADAKALLAGTFHQFHWLRYPYHLARNDEGIYYYVDVDRSSMESIRKTGHHVWLGTRGAMKQVKMIDMTSDSEGDVYVTKDGSLRFVVGKNNVEWVQNGKHEALHALDIEDPINSLLVYTDLGVYTGEMLGTPCDDL